MKLPKVLKLHSYCSGVLDELSFEFFISLWMVMLLFQTNFKSKWFKTGLICFLIWTDLPLFQIIVYYDSPHTK